MTTTTRRLATALAAAAVLGLGTAAAASASATGPNEGDGGAITTKDYLRFVNNGTALSKFKNIADSPADTNTKAIVIQNPNGAPNGSEYVFVYTNHSTKLHVAPEALKNVSLDYDTSHSVGGGSRIDVTFTDGSYAFLDPNTCSTSPYASSPWQRADFTGTTDAGGCTITYVKAGVQTPYASDGTSNALQVLGAANPGLFANQVFLIEDGAGTYVIDRLALGTDYLYNSRRDLAVACMNTESAC